MARRQPSPWSVGCANFVELDASWRFLLCPCDRTPPEAVEAMFAEHTYYKQHDPNCLSAWCVKTWIAKRAFKSALSQRDACPNHTSHKPEGTMAFTNQVWEDVARVANIKSTSWKVHQLSVLFQLAAAVCASLAAAEGAPSFCNRPAVPAPSGVAKLKAEALYHGLVAAYERAKLDGIVAEVTEDGAMLLLGGDFSQVLATMPTVVLRCSESLRGADEAQVAAAERKALAAQAALGEKAPMARAGREAQALRPAAPESPSLKEQIESVVMAKLAAGAAPISGGQALEMAKLKGELSALKTASDAAAQASKAEIARLKDDLRKASGRLAALDAAVAALQKRADQDSHAIKIKVALPEVNPSLQAGKDDVPKRSMDVEGPAALSPIVTPPVACLSAQQIAQPTGELSVTPEVHVLSMTDRY